MGLPRWLVLVVLLGSACHAPITVITPQGKIAYTADQIVVRVNELEKTAIQAEASNVIPTGTARILIQFCISADKTLATTPQGWQLAVATAWAQTRAQLPTVTNPAVLAAMSSVDVVLAALGGD